MCVYVCKYSYIYIYICMYTLLPPIQRPRFLAQPLRVRARDPPDRILYIYIYIYIYVYVY